MSVNGRYRKESILLCEALGISNRESILKGQVDSLIPGFGNRESTLKPLELILLRKLIRFSFSDRNLKNEN